MFGLGITEILIITLILVFFFGAKRIPEIGKGLGGAIKEFRKVKKEYDGDNNDNTKNNGKNKKLNESFGIEKSLPDRFLSQVPEVKKVMDAKKRIDKVKEIIK